MPEAGTVVDLLSALDNPLAKQAALDQIEQAYRENGMVIVRVIDEEQCNANLAELFSEVLIREPLKREYLPKVGNPPMPVSSEAFREWKDKVVFPSSEHAASKQRIAAIRSFQEEFNPLHGGFGACCNPEVFHLQQVWNVRQMPHIYEMHARIMGCQDLRVTLDRSFHRLPGQGNSEFIHFDINPFHRLHETEDTIYGNATQGKVAYTDSKFVAVPGTHTQEFYQDFCNDYGKLYPSFLNPKSQGVKLGIDKDKDPWCLWGFVQTFVVPAGCMVIWSDRLLHGHSKTPMSSGAEYGMFMGFFKPTPKRDEEYLHRSIQIMRGTAFTREEAILRGLDPRRGISQDHDRLRSFEMGDMPLMWPSFDPIHYYPWKFMNFPKILVQNRISKLDLSKVPTCSQTGISMLTKRKNSKGQEVPHLLPVRCSRHVKPTLTKLGMQLLAGLTQHENKRQRLILDI